jgi:hypothetical protein
MGGDAKARLARSARRLILEAFEAAAITIASATYEIVALPPLRIEEANRVQSDSQAPLLSTKEQGRG